VSPSTGPSADAEGKTETWSSQENTRSRSMILHLVILVVYADDRRIDT
jgi:hypothetical protein